MPKGCYWCKNRFLFKCKSDKRINLEKLLTSIGRPLIPTALRWIITRGESVRDEGKYIGEDCCVEKERFIFR